MNEEYYRKDNCRLCNSNKLDDAQYKIILSYMNLDNYPSFLKEIELLKNNFPDSEYIDKANNLLNKFKQ